MSKKFRLLMALVLVTGMLGGLLTSSTVSADPTPGTFIEIPRIDVDDLFGTGAWDTQIQIQNVGTASTFVTVEFWRGWSKLCPTNSPGSFYDVQQWLPVGGIWTLHSAIPAGAKSAFIVSDEPVAVTVDRWGPDAFGEFDISSSYTGIADPDMAGDRVFAPYVMHNYHDLDTVITIQNSGTLCTSVWIYYKMQGNCEFMKAQHIQLLAPGESITVGPAGFADIAFPGTGMYEPGAGNWLGSAYISATQPLAVVIDQLSLTGDNRGTLLSMRGMPYDQQLEMNWYADLLYREISGYSSSIQVQNITQDSMPTFVTVEFFDQSGDHILYVGEWVCRNGTATFYLPAIVDLGVNFPFGYVGAAEIQSHGQIDYPGNFHDGEPIFAVVDVKKTKVYDEALPGWRHTVAGETQGGAYNAHPEHQKTDAWGWAMPYIAKEQEGVTSRIVIRNNANCNKINGNIFIRDETGRAVATIPVGWLHPKHMKVIDLAYFGQIARGFVGAATFEVVGVEQLCDDDRDGHTDNLPVMPSVVVLNYGYAKELPIGGGAGPQTDEGDLTRIYEAIPFNYGGGLPCVGDIFGTVAWFDYEAAESNPEANEPLVGAAVTTIVFEEGPYDLAGRAYVGDDCAGGARLEGAYVELQVAKATGWLKKADTTTSSAGYFAFANALKLGTGELGYRLKIFVEEPGNTVSYLSAAFDDSGHWVSNFHIDTTGAGGELDLSTGEWCDLEYTAPGIAEVGPKSDVTSYAGGYELMGVTEGDKIVLASKSGFWPWVEGVTLDCGADTQLDILLVCEGTLTGTVLDAATGVPLAGALVELDITSTTLGRAWNLETTTSATGTWSLKVPLVGDDVAGDGPWTLTISLAGYDDFVDPYVAGVSNLAFADDNDFESAECFDGTGTHVYKVNGVPGDVAVDLISKAYIQGRTFCDTPVTDGFQWGEEQPNVLVRLYRDNAPVGTRGAEDAFMAEQRSDATGYYQFEISLDVDNDGMVEDTENDFIVVAHPASEFVENLGPDAHKVKNLDVCN